MLAQTNIAPVKSAILIIYDWFNYLTISYLFADAKIRKDIPKNLIRRNLSNYAAEMIQNVF